MKKQNLASVFALAAICFAASVSTPAQAAFTPLSVNIVPPVEFPPSDFSIVGARVSVLFGHHRDLYGLDLGLLGNVTDQTFTGLAISGLFNLTRGTTTVIGLQLAAITNVNEEKTHIYGLQLALGMNSNVAESTIVGLEVAALANVSRFTTVYGAQVGLYNLAREVYGLQIGLCNRATSLHGVQIGLVNFNEKGLISVAPIINIGF